ncbi:hypothetical protein INR49_021816, partial [Caranx melampygus]
MGLQAEGDLSPTPWKSACPQPGEETGGRCQIKPLPSHDPPADYICHLAWSHQRRQAKSQTLELCGFRLKMVNRMCEEGEREAKRWWWWWGGGVEEWRPVLVSDVDPVTDERPPAKCNTACSAAPTGARAGNKVYQENRAKLQSINAFSKQEENLKLRTLEIFVTPETERPAMTSVSSCDGDGVESQSSTDGVKAGLLQCHRPPAISAHRQGAKDQEGEPDTAQDRDTLMFP